MPRAALRLLAAALALCVARCAAAAVAAANASSSQSQFDDGGDAVAEFVVPPGFLSFCDYCARHLQLLSDDALDALYAEAAASGDNGTDASATNAAAVVPPRGCVPGCILAGHGTSVFAPAMGGMWRGKCFNADGTVVNYSNDAAPRLSPTVR